MAINDNEVLRIAVSINREEAVLRQLAEQEAPFSTKRKALMEAANDASTLADKLRRVG